MLDVLNRVLLGKHAVMLSIELASLSAIFVCLIYAHFIINWMDKNSLVLNWFAAAGKLSLTLYIVQSVVLAILLRWVMPEFNLTAQRIDYLLIAIIFIIGARFKCPASYHWQCCRHKVIDMRGNILN